jgi:hypothetical protein
MPLEESLLKRLAKLLSTLEVVGKASADDGVLGPRLVADARRLWDRLGRLLKLKLVHAAVDADALELACYALQLPIRQSRLAGIIGGKLGRTSLRDRCEQAAELLVSLLGDDIDEPLLDRATRVLHETPQRSPMLDEARLLADALNLDDFGLIGLLSQTIQLALHGEGAAELAVAWNKREQYGYWEVRVKEDFHFEPVRKMAQKRLEKARQVMDMLRSELEEDGTK